MMAFFSSSERNLRKGRSLSRVNLSCVDETATAQNTAAEIRNKIFERDLRDLRKPTAQEEEAEGRLLQWGLPPGENQGTWHFYEVTALRGYSGSLDGCVVV